MMILKVFFLIINVTFLDFQVWFKILRWFSYLVISQFGITIIHCGQHSFKQSKFWIKSQEKQHGKEQNWPKFGQRQFCQGRWVGNEGQTLSTGGHVFDVDAQLLGQESEDGENDHGGNDWGEKIQGWDETSICKNILFEKLFKIGTWRTLALPRLILLLNLL